MKILVISPQFHRSCDLKSFQVCLCENLSRLFENYLFKQTLNIFYEKYTTPLNSEYVIRIYSHYVPLCLSHYCHLATTGTYVVPPENTRFYPCLCRVCLHRAFKSQCLMSLIVVEIMTK